MDAAARKTFACVMVALAACAEAGSPQATGGSGAAATFDVQGHRGARGLAPENTLAAFRRAIELGVQTLELDLAVTRDGAVVVAHDPFVPAARCRTTSGAAPAPDAAPLFRDLTLAQVKAWDCGSLPPDPARFPSPPWTPSPGEPIPTLGEVFELARARGTAELRFNIETKLAPGDARTVPAEAFVAAVVEVVRAHAMTRRTTLQSFDWRALLLADAVEPGLRLAALVEPESASADWRAGFDGAALAALEQLDMRLGGRLDIVSPYWKMLTGAKGAAPLRVDELQARGWRVIPWTVNDAATMGRLIDLGVDGLISDYPDIALDVARRRGLSR